MSPEDLLERLRHLVFSGAGMAQKAAALTGHGYGSLTEEALRLFALAGTHARRAMEAEDAARERREGEARDPDRHPG
jgi:hypothetical protein